MSKQKDAQRLGIVSLQKKNTNEKKKVKYDSVGMDMGKQSPLLLETL